jgi:hypothetical protein
MAEVIADTFLSAVFRDAEAIGHPPLDRLIGGRAFDAQRAIDHRFAASREYRQLLTGEVAAYVLDGAGVTPMSLPKVFWAWSFLWHRSGELVLYDPCGRSRRVAVVEVLPSSGRTPTNGAGDPRTSREEAIRELIAEGRQPTVNGYSWNNFVNDVRARCGLDGKAQLRGFHENTLAELYNRLKRTIPEKP